MHSAYSCIKSDPLVSLAPAVGWRRAEGCRVAGTVAGHGRRLDRGSPVLEIESVTEFMKALKSVFAFDQPASAPPHIIEP